MANAAGNRVEFLAARNQLRRNVGFLGANLEGAGRICKRHDARKRARHLRLAHFGGALENLPGSPVDGDDIARLVGVTTRRENLSLRIDPQRHSAQWRSMPTVC